MIKHLLSGLALGAAVAGLSLAAQAADFPRKPLTRSAIKLSFDINLPSFS